MNLFKEFINEYGVLILYTVITSIAGYIGLVLKNLYTKYINDKTKKDVARTCVCAVEQIYKDLHGAEKLDMAISSASEMLEEKGIQISALELRMLIESALAELNKVFEEDVPQEEQEEIDNDITEEIHDGEEDKLIE